MDYLPLLPRTNEHAGKITHFSNNWWPLGDSRKEDYYYFFLFHRFSGGHRNRVTTSRGHGKETQVSRRLFNRRSAIGDYQICCCHSAVKLSVQLASSGKSIIRPIIFWWWFIFMGVKRDCWVKCLSKIKVDSWVDTSQQNKKIWVTEWKVSEK